MTGRQVLLVQLPIPPAGPSPIVGNVPLAAAYLKLYARQSGLESDYAIEILPTDVANHASDWGIVDAILHREPWMVGFTCYLWNIQRTLWIVGKLKEARPDILVVLGGPEITADNAWVLQPSAIDYAVIGEGEQTFSELLRSLQSGTDDRKIVPGLWRATQPNIPLFRQPLPNLDIISSPYLEGILDAADEKLLLLETIRGCVFKCKFCYYPKSYDALYFVSQEKIIANLLHARERGATEVVILDPTLNQRKQFNDFLRLLADHNRDHQFRFFGELRAEGIQAETAKLLREANFTEVEIGLQSIDPAAQSLMDRKNNLKAFEKGVGSMLEAGIDVKVDLIIGLPGDSVSSVRRSFDYLAKSQLFTTVQVFNLAILPGTAFRQEAEMLGLEYQDRPPYYVLNTPTLKTADLYRLMEEASDVFESEWDPFPEPKLDDFQTASRPIERLDIDLEQTPIESDRFATPIPGDLAQALTVWVRSAEWERGRGELVRTVRHLLATNPHSTMQIVLEPTGEPTSIDPTWVGQLLEACFAEPNYLDRYYSLHPGGGLGSKRILVKLEAGCREGLLQDDDRLTWMDTVGENASLVYVESENGPELNIDELAYYELIVSHDVG